MKKKEKRQLEPLEMPKAHFAQGQEHEAYAEWNVRLALFGFVAARSTGTGIEMLGLDELPPDMQEHFRRHGVK